MTDVSNDRGVVTQRPGVPLCDCFTLNMKALPSFETPGIFRVETRRHTPVCSSIALCRTADVALNCCKAHWSLYVPYSGHYMYRTVVTICTVQR